MNISNAITSWAGDLLTATQAPRGVVLFLHGYGSDERDLPGISAALPPGFAWASLRAPIALPLGGNAWFPLTSSEKPPTAQPIEASTEAIWDWVDAHVPEEVPLVPLGFSQGGLMATQLLRTRPDRLTAAVVLSGFLLPAQQPADAALAALGKPVFWGRGDADTRVERAAVEHANSWLRQHSALTAHVYTGMAHSTSRAELDDLSAFLRDVTDRLPPSHPGAHRQRG